MRSFLNKDEESLRRFYSRFGQNDVSEEQMVKDLEENFNIKFETIKEPNAGPADGNYIEQPPAKITTVDINPNDAKGLI